MEFAAVESSTVAGIVWEAGRLFVKYRDGSVYSCEASEGDHRYLMAAPSKGTHLALHFRARLKRDNGAVNLTGVENLNGGVKLSPSMSAQLNTHAADTCCSKPLIKALHANELDGKDSWDCPKCGTCWKARMVESVKHWEPTCVFEIVPMQKLR